MDQQLKERLIGVTALVLVAIVFIPMFFKKSTDLALREKENVEFINENESEFISKLIPLRISFPSTAACKLFIFNIYFSL